MTTTQRPTSFAKNMDSSNTKRLIRRKRDDAFSSCRKKSRLGVTTTSSMNSLQPTCELDDKDIAKYENTSTTNSTRLFGGIMSKSCGDNDTQVNNRNRWRSPIGTIADHRMTNNNRIRKQWHIFAVVLLSVILCVVQVTVVSGTPEPIRVSNSYTKTVSNTIPTSTTSRSTTILSSFLPSDAIPSSIINYKNFNTFAGNRSSSGSNGFLSSFVSKHIGASGSSSNNDNANSKTDQSSSKRTTTANNASRKVFSSSSSSSSPVTSIDRPFYTKITSNDAIVTPSHYKRTKSGSSKKTKKNKKSSRPFGKYSKTKGSKEQDASGSMSIEDIDNDDEYAFMPQTTEKAYHPPKLSLEPFFNFLTSLATASREVIMSKEQHHSHQHQTEQGTGGGGGTGGLGTTGSGSKYSPSYETINQSMREGAKKSKKSKKGKSSKGSKKKKGHSSKGSKKGSKGEGGKRHRYKSIEISTEEEDEEIELDPVSEEAFSPISLPNPVIADSPEDADAENDNPVDDDTKSTGVLHILDVLRTPMVPDYESQPPPPPAAKAEPLVGLDYHRETESSSDNGHNEIPKSDSANESSSSLSTPSSSAYSTNPPSGRANLNKGQGYIAFDNYEGSGTKNMSSGGVGDRSNTIQKQRSERDRDPMDSYHDQHGSGVDLQAQESISHAQVVPSPFGMKNNAAGGGGSGLGPYQYQQQQHLTKSNSDFVPSSGSGSQQVSITQANSSPFSQSKNSAEKYDDPYDKARTGKGNNEFVSKYPTTFVYQSSSSSGSGQSAPGSQPLANPSPPVSYMSASQSHNHPSQPVLPTYINPSPPGSLSHMNPSPPPAFPQNTLYGSVPPSNGHPSRMNKLRPNLHSYYDSSYHNYAGVGENQVASEMIGIRQPYGPPHFKPPSPHPQAIRNRNPFALPPPPRFVNGYGNRPGFMMPHRGSHYVGHTFNVGALPSKAPPTQSYNDPNSDYPQDVTGNGNNNSNNDDASVGTHESGGTDVTGSATGNLDQYTLSELEENSVTAAENSENKKVGIMDSFDLFYKEYKILTWVAVFAVTSMALLTLLVYLYLNNPPTEVVQARQLIPWNELLQNPQIKKFLSSLMEPSSSSRRNRKKDDPVDDDGYIKPYGYGFGGKSGKQKRKQTRNQQDKNKLVSRTNKIKRINEIGRNNSTVEAS